MSYKKNKIYFATFTVFFTIFIKNKPILLKKGFRFLFIKNQLFTI